MLKIKDNVDLKELEKFKIYPVYECNHRTGETRIKALETEDIRFEKLWFKRKKKKIAKLRPVDIYANQPTYILEMNKKTDEMIDLDTLYNLIKADIVEKV